MKVRFFLKIEFFLYTLLKLFLPSLAQEREKSVHTGYSVITQWHSVTCKNWTLI